IDENYARVCPNQFGRISPDEVRISCWPSEIELNVAAFYPPEVLEAFLKRRDERLCFGIAGVECQHHSDPTHPLGLLCTRSERQDSPTANQRDELPPPHSITSSARASTIGDSSMPMAMAVRRFIRKSNLVGRSNGRSPGFAPLSTRSSCATRCRD